jgi:large subunit ribosomal protein L17
LEKKMRHGISGRKFNRTSSHRQAMFSNLCQALIEHGQIVTTLPKAKDLRPVIEKLITIAKKGGIHSRRILVSRLRSEAHAAKLAGVLAERFAARQGGYTRIMKHGFRYGDNAPMAVIEFVDR